MNDFKPPNSLEEVDFSNNEISEISDMSVHKYLKRLNLNNNSISKIEGLEKNTNLEILMLSHNNIEEIQNLDNLNLTELYLFGNNIKYVYGLDKLPKLRILDLSRNRIKRIKGLSELVSLRSLYLSDNQISKVRSLNYIENLMDLSDLDLCYNPIQKRRYYRFQVIFKLPQLRSLDGVAINEKEAVKSENFFGLDNEERKAIFLNLLPEEEFVDRRVHKSEFLDPESDSDIGDELDFADKYDSQGKQIKVGPITPKSESAPNRSGREKLSISPATSKKQLMGQFSPSISHSIKDSLEKMGSSNIQSTT